MKRLGTLAGGGVGEVTWVKREMLEMLDSAESNTPPADQND